MKIIPLMILCCSFLFSLTAVAQFEGQVDMTIVTQESGKPETISLSTLVKDDLVATTMKGGKDVDGKFIVRGDKQVLWVINDEEKNYIEMPLKEGKAPHGDMMKKAQEKAPEVTVTKTGKKQTILGYPCEEWEATTGTEVTSIWGTTKLGNIYSGLAKSMTGPGHQKMGGSWEKKVGEMGIFPLKTTVTRNGKTVQTLEVTKIDARKLAASAFEAPAGYEKQSFDVDLEKMMQQMQQMKKD